MNKDIYFETIKCDDFIVYNLSYHKKRMMNTIGLNIDLQEYIYPPNGSLLKSKVIYDKNGILDISYEPYHKKMIKSFQLIHSDISYSQKKLDRTKIDKLVRLSNSDEIIIVKDNLITDTSIANIAIFHNDTWITPKKPLLVGTTLSRYINNKILTQEDITIDMLKNSKKIALLNAMIDFDIVENYNIVITN